MRHHFGRRAVADDRAAVLAGTGAQIEDAIGLDHDLRIVLDHQQRVARIAQPLHDADHALHVARMQSDRRLIEHEQRIDQRGAERGGQIDALDFAAGERARLAIERQVAEPDVAQELQPRAQLAQQQIRGLIERLRQCQCIERNRGSARSAAASAGGSPGRSAALERRAACPGATAAHRA